MAKVSTLRLGLALLAALATPLAGSGARADDADDQARDRYERAIALYEEGVYDASLVELRRAYELRPSFKLLYNIAQVRLAMKDHAGALEAFQQYLRDGASKVPSARRIAVEQELASLERRVARLVIQVDLDGTELLIDDAPIGTSPLRAPVLVNSGQRRVSARHPDRPAQSVRVSIAGGEQQEIVLRVGEPGAAVTRAPVPAPIVATSTPAAPLPEVQLAPEPSRPLPARAGKRYAAWVGWAATGALGATTVGLAIAARRESNELADARASLGTSADAKHSELEELRDRTKTLARTSDILLGATVAAAGLSLWLTLRDRSPSADSPFGGRASVSPATRMQLGPTGVRLRTEF